MNIAMKVFSNKAQRGGYTLVETLLAAAVLMIGVGAAASLTLTMNTQEEITWRVARGINTVENTAVLYSLGLDFDEALDLLPTDSEVSIKIVDSSEGQENPMGSVVLDYVDFTAKIETVPDEGSWTGGSWTGGSDNKPAVRSMQVRAYRSTFDQFDAPSPGKDDKDKDKDD